MILFAATYVLFFFAVINGAALPQLPGSTKPAGNTPPSPEVNHGITDELLWTFNLMSQYAAASYCPTNNNSTGTPLVCSAGNCPMVECAGATTIDEFLDSPQWDTTGFVATDKMHKLIVLSFRGSVSTENWKADLTLERVHTNLCNDCHIHHGFWNSWTGVRDAIIPLMLQATTDYPDYRVIVTGHSLGGAVATVAAAALRKQSEHLALATELYSFGSPRVTNKKGAKWMSEQSNKSWRITSKNDVVPRLLPRLTGYHHTWPEYWIRSNPMHPSKDDIDFSDDVEKQWGNVGEFFVSKKAHHRYFGNISACN